MKPIYMSEDMKEYLRQEFEKQLSSAVVKNGSVTVTASFVSKPEETIRPLILFTPEAFMKIEWLIQNFASEVAWQGYVERNGNTYRVTDIVVYPQDVSSATVVSEEKEYGEWTDTLSDEQLNSLRFQGHSHVNMAVNPSSTDLDQQASFVKQMGEHDFYIFMIRNKRGDMELRLYSMEENVVYETKDLDWNVESAETDWNEFQKTAKERVRGMSKPFSPATNASGFKQSSYGKKTYYNDPPKSYHGYPDVYPYDDWDDVPSECLNFYNRPHKGSR